jgi:hypothetical protein
MATEHTAILENTVHRGQLRHVQGFLIENTLRMSDFSVVAST